MADDSELDYVRTFLGKVHTTATVKHIEEAGKIDFINDTQKMLLFPPELVGSDGEDFYWKKYKIQISETTEATMMTAINNILIGIKKFNRRTAITDFTRPGTMCHIKFSNSNRAFFNIKSKRWTCDIWIDVEWSTS